MTRRVVITGVGPVSGLGLGIEQTWQAACAGQSALGPIQAFDPAGFECKIAGEVTGLKIRDVVPKSYRKATKVMSRDIQLAVAAADLAACDGGLVTQGIDPDREPTYAPQRVGAHIGAGLIAAELSELTLALDQARRDGSGDFDIHKWGAQGMGHLPPLFLLQYLPNMLACHVTIIHDSRGPSNTITCSEASSGLSVGESLRVIQRGSADACFCGGAESKINPVVFLRQQLGGCLTTANSAPTAAVRPFDQAATGAAMGEGGGIVILEALESAQKRNANMYAELVGFGATQSVHRASANRKPEPDGRGSANAITIALGDAGVTAEQIDLIVPYGSGAPLWDQAEAKALRSVFAERLKEVPVMSFKALVGNCGAGGGAVELCLTAAALKHQTVPAIINRDQPLEGFSAEKRDAVRQPLRYALIYSTGFGGQNTALVLKAM